MRVGGVDEAGKGPVIGPMCVACVVADSKDVPELKMLGVKDSKKLSPEKRKMLADEITQKYEVAILLVTPKAIDEAREKMTMNDLMVKTFSSVIRRGKVDVAYVDAADVNEVRFGKRLETLTGIRIESMHKADEMIPLVSAASIVAKVTRDREI